MIKISEEERWLSEIIDAFIEFGGIAHLSDLHKFIEENSDRELPPSWQEIISKNIGRYSSDSNDFLDIVDIFYSVEGLGGGVWGLRDFDKKLDSSSLDELREKALANSTQTTSVGSSKSKYYKLSRYIKAYAKKRAKGVCENCSNKAPFINQQGDPYLEVHHIRKLSDGGADHPLNVATICPNCHREAHKSKDHVGFNEKLKIIITEKEEKISSK